ncbi:hypothetical protein NDU88_003269 [Pleurodeles waltl]|uniref:Uncharacterized protein n=1 Tax=Pleurodeles waltl TaxID=8319 RepID=A0AAV7QCH0_PLEWA|nr:hypothetical protein NDU88_003269 [Pleurodeles waltl]
MPIGLRGWPRTISIRGPQCLWEKLAALRDLGRHTLFSAPVQSTSTPFGFSGYVLLGRVPVPANLHPFVLSRGGTRKQGGGERGAQAGCGAQARAISFRGVGHGMPPVPTLTVQCCRDLLSRFRLLGRVLVRSSLLAVQAGGPDWATHPAPSLFTSCLPRGRGMPRRPCKHVVRSLLRVRIAMFRAGRPLASRAPQCRFGAGKHGAPAPPCEGERPCLDVRGGC